MKAAFVSCVSCLLMVVPATAQPGAKGPPPVLKMVSSIDKETGRVNFQTTVTNFVPVQVQMVVIVNGKQETVTTTQYVQEMRQIMETIKPADGRVITPDGKQLPIEEVWKRVKANMVVAVSADGNTPNEAFLRALSAETLILIAPRQGPPPPPPPPVPEPKKS